MNPVFPATSGLLFLSESALGKSLSEYAIDKPPAGQGVTTSSRSLPKPVDRRLLKTSTPNAGAVSPNSSGTSPRTTRSQIFTVQLVRLPSPWVVERVEQCYWLLSVIGYSSSVIGYLVDFPERDPSGQERERTARSATIDFDPTSPPEGCCNMHTPMSVRSMGLTSSGHPRPGSGGPTEPLRHRRLRIACSGQHAPRRRHAARSIFMHCMAMQSLLCFVWRREMKLGPLSISALS
jgi:hypothetical protein